MKVETIRLVNTVDVELAFYGVKVGDEYKAEIREDDHAAYFSIDYSPSRTIECVVYEPDFIIIN